MSRYQPKAATFGHPMSNPVMERRQAKKTERRYVLSLRWFRQRVMLRVDARQFVAAARATSTRLRDIIAAVERPRTPATNAFAAFRDLAEAHQ